MNETEKDKEILRLNAELSNSEYRVEQVLIEYQNGTLHEGDVKQILDNIISAALAKQGSPPPNRDSLEAEQLAYEIISDLHSILGSKMDGHIREVRVKVQERIANEIVALSPPADTVERARGAQVEGIIEDWIAANPSLVGELEIQIVRDLSDRISAALENATAELRAIRGCDKCDLCEDHAF